MAAIEDADGWNRPDPFLIPLFVPNTLSDVDVGPGSCRSIGGELITPLVKNVSMGVGSDREMELKFKRPRVETVDARCSRTEGRGWRFEICDIKNSS